MAAAAKTVLEVNNIIGGNGAVDLAEGLAALAAATGIVAFTKKIGLWAKFSAVEQHEVEMLDKAMPQGWWGYMKNNISAVTMSGKRFRWHHGHWSAGPDDNGNLLITTPILDEETDLLV